MVCKLNYMVSRTGRNVLGTTMSKYFDLFLDLATHGDDRYFLTFSVFLVSRTDNIVDVLRVMFT